MASGYSTSTALEYLIPQITERADYVFQNAAIGRALVTYRDVSGIPGLTVEFPRWTTVDGSATVAETAVPTSHAMALTSATLTIARRSIYVLLGFLAEKGMSDPVSEIGVAMGMAKAKAQDVSIFNVITTTNYATSAGATDAALSLTHVLNGLNLLQVNEVDKPVYAVIHPFQQKSIVSGLAPVAASTDTTTIKISNPLSNQAVQDAMWSRLFGIDWFVTARVSSRTVVATADVRSGLIFHPKGIGYAYSELGSAPLRVLDSTDGASHMIMDYADVAGVLYSSAVCTLYSTSA